MRLTSILSYLLSGLMIYASGYVAEGEHFSLWMFWDISSFIAILGAFIAVLINFKFSEVYNAIVDGLSNLPRKNFQERIEVDKLVINSIWKYTLQCSLLVFIISLIIILGNIAETSKLGPSISVCLIIMLYAVMVKFLLVNPLLISIEKKSLVQI